MLTAPSDNVDEASEAGLTKTEKQIAAVQRSLALHQRDVNARLDALAASQKKMMESLVGVVGVATSGGDDANKLSA